MMRKILIVFLLVFALTPLALVKVPALPPLALAALIIFCPGQPPTLPLVLAVMIALLPAPNPALALFSTWWSLVLVLATGSLREVDKDALASALIQAATIQALAALLLTPIGRAYGLLSNANVAASFLALALPLAMARARWLTAGLIAAGLVATGSVGGILASLAGVTLTMVLNSKIRAFMSNHRQLLGIGVVLVILAIGGLIFLALARPYGTRRLELWQVAVSTFEDHPVAGAGPLSFRVAWNNRGNRDHVHAHNLYLNVLAERGLVGIVALAALGGWALWVTRRTPSAQAGIVALAVHSLVDATALQPVIAFEVCALIGLAALPRARPGGNSAVIVLTVIVLAGIAALGVLWPGVAMLYALP